MWGDVIRVKKLVLWDWTIAVCFYGWQLFAVLAVGGHNHKVKYIKASRNSFDFKPFDRKPPLFLDRRPPHTSHNQERLSKTGYDKDRQAITHQHDTSTALHPRPTGTNNTFNIRP
jgi:hypothetical protein